MTQPIPGPVASKGLVIERLPAHVTLVVVAAPMSPVAMLDPRNPEGSMQLHSRGDNVQRLTFGPKLKSDPTELRVAISPDAELVAYPEPGASLEVLNARVRLTATRSEEATRNGAQTSVQLHDCTGSLTVYNGEHKAMTVFSGTSALPFEGFEAVLGAKAVVTGACTSIQSPTKDYTTRELRAVDRTRSLGL